MDLCIKTGGNSELYENHSSFNPCFNGSMYKNLKAEIEELKADIVSILVLMDLCIKTLFHTS